MHRAPSPASRAPRVPTVAVGAVCVAGVFCAIAAGCNVTEPAATTSKGVLSLTPSTLVDTADASRTVLLTAAVDTLPRPTSNSVTFTTTAGQFLGASPGTSFTAVANDSGLARAQLVAPSDSAVALVTATAGGGSRTVRVTFVSAPATLVRVTADSFAVTAKQNQTTAVTATLLRQRGTPSPGTVVTFSADTLGGRGGGIGQFIPTMATASGGTVTSRFTVGPVSYRGTVVIRATATRDGKSVSDSTLVRILAP